MRIEAKGSDRCKPEYALGKCGKTARREGRPSGLFGFFGSDSWKPMELLSSRKIVCLTFAGLIDEVNAAIVAMAVIGQKK